MKDTVALPLPSVRRPRAEGSVRLSSKAVGPVSALDGLRMSGAMKALFPREEAGRLTAMVLNSAGGITGGDRLAVEARAGAGSRLTVTTQAAERIYAAEPDETGRVENRLAVAAGARADWLPQETILYDKARLVRSLEIELAEGAALLAVEAMVFGRTARGERLADVAVSDRISLRRGGRLVWQDTLRLSGDAHAALAGPATGGGAGAAATVLYVAPDAEALLPAIRAVLPMTGGATLARPGLAVVRLVALDGFALRQSLVPLLTHLNGSALPRSWML